MSRMMDIRDRILEILDEKPGVKFTIGQIAQAIGSTNKAATAALNKLLQNNLVDRPQKGRYTSKRRPTAASAPEPERPREIRDLAPPQPVTGVSLSVVTIELLVEREESQIDINGVLGRIREDKAVLDARVRKVVDADQSKLKIRFALADED